MNYKLFILLIILGTIIAWINLLMVIFNFDPFQAGFFGLSFFYVNAFLGLSGLFFLLLDAISAKLSPQKLTFNRVRDSVRHAVLFTCLIIGWIFLQGSSLLRWWNLLLLIALLTVLEFFFISTKKAHRPLIAREAPEEPPAEMAAELYEG